MMELQLTADDKFLLVACDGTFERVPIWRSCFFFDCFFSSKMSNFVSKNQPK